MEVRKLINQYPKTSTSILALLVGAVLWLAWSSLNDNPGLGRQFYTDDDGKTWYSDYSGKMVPFIHNGHEVVMAEVFQSGDKKFVAYMRRYTAGALEQLKNSKPYTRKIGGPVTPRMEYKIPGDTKWHDIEGDIKAMSEYLNLDRHGTNLTQVEP